ncbi:hypothetical protein DMH04_13680 [Kibdelosporangium aridum]|uniref:ABM domain-containing protein n=1 Tax=Kibdelosporangium aridum TaxID=2030 RepID=A0A428ZDW3_KIBAR|nr:hypothetical protein DMH04_13680 [Kibdelosporangium aridum]
MVVVSSHRVSAGQDNNFKVAANSLLSLAARSRGYLDGDLVRSPTDDSAWQIVCRFDSEKAADDWRDEASRSLWADVLERSTQRPASADQEPEPRTVSTKPVSKPTQPPRWKMAVVTLIAVFPAVLGTNVIVISQLTGLALIPRTFVLCVIVTALMTWVLMPRLMKLLGPWLRRGLRAAGEPVRTTTPDEPREVLSDDTIPIPIPLPAARPRHRPMGHRVRPHPPARPATSPGRQVPTGRR